MFSGAEIHVTVTFKGQGCACSALVSEAELIQDRRYPSPEKHLAEKVREVADDVARSIESKGATNG